ncbi:tRNA pseudouridine(13) synthase TruD [Dokdonella sp.]|uniref:tRNA pseudouridine(13) synthase TruD n=1 Tax=Dokdonella sp. TaxID=2291710 RepID=UPI0031C672F5|nr:tRNA pseudouridine(13) synthase TruD [Dokdonella sp.]
MAQLPFAHGGPVLRARLRAQAADFVVEEVLGFAPDGSGEHVFVQVEKIGANTDWVAGRLAAFARVPPAAVGYAGLKDRHALTWQTFSVHLPGRADPDWSALAVPGVRVLAAERHSRKLKRGAHRGNRFRICLREAEGDHERAAGRLAALAADGVPNYFGEQRFGRDGGNLELARALFAGQALPRAQRGFALSAARAEIFNAVLAARVAAGSWNRGLDGEVWMLAGSQSVFGPEPMDEALARRVSAADIHPTGPLWGRGNLRSGAAVRVLEERIASEHADFAQGLERAGLAQERRALRLPVAGLAWEWQGGAELVLSFELARGSFATTVLRELCDWSPAVHSG